MHDERVLLWSGGAPNEPRASEPGDRKGQRLPIPTNGYSWERHQYARGGRLIYTELRLCGQSAGSVYSRASGYYWRIEGDGHGGPHATAYKAGYRLLERLGV